MKLKFALFGATALGTLVSTSCVALAAGGNSTVLNELGNNNVLSVVQSDSSGGNTAGNGTQPVTQNGDHNSLSANQSANSTLGVGTPGSTSGYEYGWYRPSTYLNGVDQTGDYNSLNVTQTGGALLQVQQSAPHGSPLGTTNSATINQTTNFNGGAYIGSITQTYNNTYGTDPNTLNVTQSALSTDPGFSHRNAIDTLFQRGYNNQLTVNQPKSDNTLIEGAQDGHGNIGLVTESGAANWVSYFDQVGNGNSAGVTISGNNNGGNNFNTNSPVAGWSFAFDSGATSNSLRQKGDGNGATVSIVGNGNIFGVGQEGNGNSIGGLTISGNYNSVGLYQKNDGNVISIANVGGDYNDIGVRQNGPSNTASINSTASDSRIWVDEEGGSNNVSATQSGSWGYINASVVGSSNQLILRQANAVGATPDTSGAGNVANVTVTGSGNNLTGPSLSGAAYSAFLTGYGHDSTFNTLGDLYQTGSSDTLQVSVLTNNNDFMTMQEGSGNQITHNVTSGNGNMAVIVQIGSGNVSNTSQSGMGNNIGVTQ